MQVPRLPIAKGEVAREADRRHHDEPPAARAGAPFDVAQLVLELPHRETEQLAERRERERVAAQEAAQLLSDRSSRTDAGRGVVVFFAPGRRHAASPSHRTPPVTSHRVRMPRAAISPARRTSHPSQASAPRANATANTGTSPSRYGALACPK